MESMPDAKDHLKVMKKSAKAAIKIRKKGGLL
jgi:hypothetical protein